MEARVLNLEGSVPRMGRSIGKLDSDGAHARAARRWGVPCGGSARAARQSLNSVASFFFTRTPLIFTYSGNPFL